MKISQDIKRSPVDGSDISNFTISSNDFLSLYKFTRSAGIRMIFDLNVLLRNADGSWNSDNAKEIIRFAKGHGMELDWQMGNGTIKIYMNGSNRETDFSTIITMLFCRTKFIFPCLQCESLRRTAS